MNNVIRLDFEGRPVEFNGDGWLNATKIAKSFGMDPYEWRRAEPGLNLEIERGRNLLQLKLGLGHPTLDPKTQEAQ